MQHESDDTRGLTLREIVIEMRADQKRFMEIHHREHDRIDNDVRARPTRKELVGLLSAAGALSGIIFGAITLLG